MCKLFAEKVEHDLSFPHFHTFVLIAHEPNITTDTLVKRTHMSRPAIVIITRELQDNYGLIEAIANPVDRRRLAFRLTLKGEQFFQELTVTLTRMFPRKTDVEKTLKKPLASSKKPLASSKKPLASSDKEKEES
jgi:DNA-binding MarR family transcriptional regulator